MVLRGKLGLTGSGPVSSTVSCSLYVPGESTSTPNRAAGSVLHQPRVPGAHAGAVDEQGQAAGLARVELDHRTVAVERRLRVKTVLLVAADDQAAVAVARVTHLGSR